MRTSVKNWPSLHLMSQSVKIYFCQNIAFDGKSNVFFSFISEFKESNNLKNKKKRHLEIFYVFKGLSINQLMRGRQSILLTAVFSVPGYIIGA